MDKSEAAGLLQVGAESSGRDRPKPKAKSEACLARPVPAKTGGVKPWSGPDAKRSEREQANTSRQEAVKPQRDWLIAGVEDFRRIRRWPSF